MHACASARAGLWLAERLFGFIQRLEQILQDRLFAGVQLDTRLHAGPDFQRVLARRQILGIHRQRHLVVRIAIRIARALVLECIG